MKPLASSASLKGEEFVFIAAIDVFPLISAELCHPYQSAQLGDALQAAFQMPDCRSVSQKARRFYFEALIVKRNIYHFTGEICLRFRAPRKQMAQVQSARVSGSLVAP